MISLPANWVAAFAKAEAQPVFLVKLTLDSGTYSATDKYCALTPLNAAGTSGGYAVSVARVSPHVMDMDPWTRKPKISEVTVSFINDGWLSDIFVANRIKNKKVEVLIGEASLAEADYVSILTGIASHPKCNSYGGGEIVVSDMLRQMIEKKIWGNWINQHPIEALEDILTTHLDIPSAQVDSTSFDPDTYTGSISHYVISRGQNESYFTSNSLASEPQDAAEVIGEICEMLDGQILWLEDNKIYFKRFDSTTAIVDTWTDDDIAHEITVDEIDGNMRNDIGCAFFSRLGDDHTDWYAIYNSDSGAAFTYPGGSDFAVSAFFYKNKWITGHGILYHTSGITDVSPTVGGTLYVRGMLVYGMCGTRWPSYATLSQPASAVLSTTRYAYLKIDQEIIKVRACTVSAYTSGNIQYTSIVDPDTGLLVTSNALPELLTYEVAQRGALGTTPAAHDFRAVVQDITMAVALCENRLTRWSYGVPIIRVRTNISKYGVQLTDFVALSTTRYAAYGSSGLDANTKWEVIGKSLDLSSGSPKIEWKLAWATQTSPASVTKAHSVYSVDGISGPNRQLGKSSEGQSIAQRHIISGFTASTAGLNVTIAPGVASSGVLQSQLLNNQVVVVANNSDTYVYWSLSNFAVVARNVATAAAEPDRLNQEIPLHKCAASGGSVTLTDMRPLLALDGGKLTASSVVTSKLPDSAITTAKINSQAVTAAKIGDEAVTPVHIEIAASPAARYEINPNFQSWTRG